MSYNGQDMTHMRGIRNSSERETAQKSDRSHSSVRLLKTLKEFHVYVKTAHGANKLRSHLKVRNSGYS